MTILVTGGAGFIGSHFVQLISAQPNTKVIVVDNYYQGKENILKRDNVTYHEVDICNLEKLQAVFKESPVDAVVHFAAIANVPDSIARPAGYYQANIIGGWNLLACMLENGVKKIIFSSSAAVYGEPLSDLIKEDHQKKPINPYGYTKLAFEIMLKDYHTAYGINSVSFRYFCAAGREETGEINEHHIPETHVIPMLLETVTGKRKEFCVYGNDFPTPDGTGIRDYIHVSDLAEAHASALDVLMKGNSVCTAYNLGTNRGCSVMELITAVEKASGKKVPYAVKPRRPGDASVLVADATAARRDLGWLPKYISIDSIIESVYKFYR